MWLAFESYRDIREPIVRISDDGTLGWVIAEVEVVGSIQDEGRTTRFADVWAWVELYEKQEGRWYMVGNVSNSRPLEDGRR